MAVVKTMFAPVKKESPLILSLRAKYDKRAKKVIADYNNQFKKMGIEKSRPK